MKYFSFLILAFLICSCRPNDKLAPWIPDNFEILDSISGFINADTFIDYVAVLRIKDEQKFVNVDANQPVRPLIILFGQPNGTFKLIDSNDSCVRPFYMGWMTDPYLKMCIKDNSIKIIHLTGSAIKNEQITQFKYIQNEFYLQSESFRSYIELDTDSVLDYFKRTDQQFGKVTLKDYSIYADYDRLK